MLAALAGNATYLRQLATRALVLWLLVRAALALLAVLARGSAGSDAVGLSGGFGLAPPPVTVLLIALVVATLAQVDARVVRATLFYANLGVPRHAPALTAAVVVFTLEVLIAALV